MKFKSDNHRKAVFANLFNRGGKRTKVNSSSVTNFEVKSTKMKVKSYKPLKFKYEHIRLKDVKTKSGKEVCQRCKRKDLSLTKGQCKECEKGFKDFKQPVSKSDNEKKVDQILGELVRFVESDVDHYISEHLERWHLDDANDLRERFEGVSNNLLGERNIHVRREAFLELDEIYGEATNYNMTTRDLLDPDDKILLIFQGVIR